MHYLQTRYENFCDVLVMRGSLPLTSLILILRHPSRSNDGKFASRSDLHIILP